MAYLFRRTITIDHTKCGGSNSSNFPILVYINDPTFKTTGNGGHVTNSNGYDIIFTSDVNGASPLYWEIEFYDGTNGILWAWVKIPTLSYTADTIIYTFYGNSSISTFQSTASSVWDGNYGGVWHLKNGSTLSVADSTVNANNGTNNGASAGIGQVDGAANFNGFTNYVDLGGSTSINIGSPITVESWVNSSGSSQSQTILSNFDTLIDVGFTLQIYSSWGGGGGNWQFVCGTHQATAGSAITLYTWYHVVGVYDGTTGQIYINGSSSGSFSASSVLAPSDVDVSVGVLPNIFPPRDTNYWSGLIDEVRISNTARSADWILSSYNNQSSPSSFLSLGLETYITSGSFIAFLGA